MKLTTNSQGQKNIFEEMTQPSSVLIGILSNGCTLIKKKTGSFDSELIYLAWKHNVIY